MLSVVKYQFLLLVASVSSSSFAARLDGGAVPHTPSSEAISHGAERRMVC